MKRVVIVLFFGILFLAGGVNANINGTIKDSGGSPIPNAEVEIWLGDFIVTSAMTNIYGEYNIAGLDYGIEYIIRAYKFWNTTNRVELNYGGDNDFCWAEDFEGFIPKTNSIVEPREGENLTLDLFPIIGTEIIRSAEMSVFQGSSSISHNVIRSLKKGDVITTKDQEGVSNGIGINCWEDQRGRYALYVFGDDPVTPGVDEGSLNGETFDFFINNFSAVNISGQRRWSQTGGTVDISTEECGPTARNARSDSRNPLTCEVGINTKFVPGEHYIAEGIDVRAGGITIDCDGSTLVGSRSRYSRGIQVILPIDDLAIKNCNFANYSKAIYVTVDVIDPQPNTHYNFRILNNNVTEGVEHGFWIKGVNGLRIEGNTFDDLGRSAHVITKGENVVLKDNKILSTSYLPDGYSSVHGSINVSFISNKYLDWLLLSDNTGPLVARNNDFKDMMFIFRHQEGIILENNNFHNCEIREIGDFAIIEDNNFKNVFIRDSGSPSIIRNNNFSSNDSEEVYFSKEVYFNSVSLFASNDIQGHAIKFQAADHSLIENNYFHGISQLVVQGNYTTIKNNLFKDNYYTRTDGWIDQVPELITILGNSNHLDIYDNTFLENLVRGGIGINTYDGTSVAKSIENISIHHNIFREGAGGHLGWDALNVHASFGGETSQLRDIEIYNNLVDRSSIDGVTIYGVSSQTNSFPVKVFNNEIIGPYYGIALQQSDGILVKNNTVLNASMSSFRIHDGSLSHIVQNTFHNEEAFQYGGFGMNFIESSNNFVYLNSIKSFRAGVITENEDYTSSVPMEVSYAGIGNYWGHETIPCFIAGGSGGDSNSGDVIDSHPFCEELQTDSQLIFLSYGWNLIGLNVFPEDISPGNVLNSISGYYDLVQNFYDNDADQYKPSNPSPLNDLTEIVPWYGYWIKMTGTPPNDLVILGDEVSGCNPLNLQSTPNPNHWVGYWQQEETLVEDALSSVAGNYESVRTYKNGVWESYNPNLPPQIVQDLTMMKPGQGYMITMSNTDDLDYLC